MDFVPKSARSQDDEMPGFADTLEQWPQQRIYGDFYREPVEDVVRGVTFPDTLESASGFKFGGDYYREQEDVFKGLTLAQMPEESMFGLDNGQGQNEKKNPWSWESSTTAGTAKSFDEEWAFKHPQTVGVPCAHQSSSTLPSVTQVCQAPALRVEFQESDHPPPKPLDPHWSFEVTTAFVQMKHPWVLGCDTLKGTVHELNDLTCRHESFSMCEIFDSTISELGRQKPAPSTVELEEFLNSFLKQFKRFPSVAVATSSRFWCLIGSVQIEAPNTGPRAADPWKPTGHRPGNGHRRRVVGAMGAGQMALQTATNVKEEIESDMVTPR